MTPATFTRTTANALFSLFLAGSLYAQAPAATAPVNATEKRLQTFTLGTLSSVNCTTNVAWLTCPGGPFTDGTIPLIAPTQDANKVLAGPGSGAAAIPDFRIPVGSDFLAWKSPYMICSSAVVDVTSSNSETTLFSCLIPAGGLGTNGAVKIRLTGDGLINDGSDDTFTIKVKYGCPSAAAACVGGADLYNNAAAALTAQATRFPTVWDVDLHALAATNSQTGALLLSFGGFTAPTTGVGTITGTYFSSSVHSKALGFATTAVNDTAASYLIITFQWSTNTANLSMRASGYGILYPGTP